MDFTEEQLRVIKAGGDLLVTASAGCGKTTVMLQRVLRLISAGTPLSRMLIATFTNAAAADMRDKLNRLLRAEYDKTQNPFIRGQYEALPVSDISTLHTWCVKLIRKYFFVTGDDPAFEIAGGAEAAVWKREAIERAVGEFSARPEPAELFETYTFRRKTAKIYSVVSDLIEFAAAQADGAAWLDGAASHYESERVREYLRQKEIESLTELETLFTGFEASAKSAGVWQKAEGYLTALRAAAAGSDVPLPRAVGITAVKDEYDSLKKAVQKIEDARAERMSFRAEEARAAAEVFIGIAKAASAYYAEKKEEQARLDFNDLERKAKAILLSDYGGEIRGGYDYIFIDEYQDINPLQEDIIRLLKGDNTMFFVGDIKQSIYSFRNCSPAAFTAKARELPPGQVLPLSSNFRCDGGILKFCNNVFSRIMTESFGQTDYARAAMFDIRGGAAGGSVEIVTVPEKEKRTDEAVTFDTVYSVRGAAVAAQGGREPDGEATAAASKIIELLGQTITENDCTRPCGYDDIAVIVRSRGGCAGHLADILRAAGVPVSLSRDLSLTDSKYARDLLSYLRLIDNRRNDIALVGAMRSYFGGFTDNELAELRRAGRSGSFFSCVERAAATPDASCNKVRDFMLALDRFTLMSRGIAPGALAGKVTAHFDYFKYVIGQEDGARHADAVSALLDEMNSYNGCLSDWLKYIDEADPDAECCAAGGSVRIMTAHASKGLEFPFVVLCNLGRRFSTADIKDGMCDSEFGLGLMSRNREMRRKYPTDVLSAAKIKKEHASKEEELRILYVAMTRAKYKLVILLPASGDTGVSPSRAVRASDWLLPHAAAWGMKPHTPLPEITRAEPAKTLNPKTLAAIERAAETIDLPKPRDIKGSVTKLKRRVFDEDEPVEKELTAGGEDAKDAGIAYHKALELYDYSQGTGQIRALLERVENGHLIDERKFTAAVGILAERVRGRKIYREQMFIYKAGKEITGSTDMIVQGVIDMLITDGGQCEIIDYKTGRLTGNENRVQLDYYADAAEKILGLRVVKKSILSIEEGTLIEYK